MSNSKGDKPDGGDKLVNSGKPWTAQEIDYLVSARHHGATAMELAAYLKRDPNEVDAKCDFFGM